MVTHRKRHVKLAIKTLLTIAGWKHFLKVLSRKEKIIFFALASAFLLSFVFLSTNFYFTRTEEKPSWGGTYTEGVIGSPRFINPIYSSASDVDRDLTELIYSGLMKYDEDGKVIPDLAKDYEILNDGKIYEIGLKNNIFWQDKEKLKADDIIFTIKTIQNPVYKSPIRPNWLGVEVEKVSDLKIRFILKDVYAPFLENLTLKILPKHIWEDISPENFPLSVFNLKPIGSGPFKIGSLDQDKNNGSVKSLDLIRNENYFGKIPFLEQISFRFFSTEKEIISAFNKGEIKGFAPRSPQNIPKTFFDLNLYSFSLPRYFAIFFNTEMASILSQKEVRYALNYATNKQEIVKKVLSEKGRVVISPILPEIYGFQSPSIQEYNPGKAIEILEEAGFKKVGDERIKTVKKTPVFQFKNDLNIGSRGTEVKELQKCLAKDKEVYEGDITSYFGELTKNAVIRFQEKYKSEILAPWNLEKGTGKVSKSTRAKLNELCFSNSEETIKLKLSLSTIEESSLSEVASILKNQWEAIGIDLEIKTFGLSSLEQDIIKPRNYEMLLFGEVLSLIPDPFPFWHSSLRKDPGLNLASYNNKKSDQLLEQARQALDLSERKEKLEKFQELLIEDSPAIFLYSPDYLYFVSKEIKGIKDNKTIVDPSKRFSNIENWHIKTKRLWK